MHAYLLLFYTVATVFKLYPGGDMIYEMIRRKPEPTPLGGGMALNAFWKRALCM